jgi:nucleosome binding factor SPN SPT16 subunit
MEIIAENNIQDTSSATQYKTPSYTRRAINKYQEKNKDKLREYARTRRHERYQNDPEFRERERKKALERYHKKKMEEEIIKIK